MQKTNFDSSITFLLCGAANQGQELNNRMDVQDERELTGLEWVLTHRHSSYKDQQVIGLLLT